MTRLLALARRIAALLDDGGALGRALVADLDAGAELYLAALREGLCPGQRAPHPDGIPTGAAARQRLLLLAAAGLDMSPR